MGGHVLYIEGEWIDPFNIHLLCTYWYVLGVCPTFGQHYAVFRLGGERVTMGCDRGWNVYFNILITHLLH